MLLKIILVSSRKLCKLEYFNANKRNFWLFCRWVSIIITNHQKPTNISEKYNIPYTQTFCLFSSHVNITVCRLTMELVSTENTDILRHQNNSMSFTSTSLLQMDIHYILLFLGLWIVFVRVSISKLIVTEI